MTMTPDERLDAAADLTEDQLEVSKTLANRITVDMVTLTQKVDATVAEMAAKAENNHVHSAADLDWSGPLVVPHSSDPTVNDGNLAATTAAVYAVNEKIDVLAGETATVVWATSQLAGKADLVNGLIPSHQLPSTIDEIQEFTTFGDFPVTGDPNLIYLALDTDIQYRWSGTQYSAIPGSLTLGTTAATAYRGDRGSMAYDHSQAPHAPVDAQANVQSDWLAEAGDAMIKNKPTTMDPNPHLHDERYLKSLVGLIQLMPFRHTELPDGWYFCNGDQYPDDSPQGLALASLPGNFRSDWGITVDGGLINLPNLFSPKGRGYFFRPADGTTRTVGSIEDDAVINVSGEFGGFGWNHHSSDNSGQRATGPFSNTHGAVINLPEGSFAGNVDTDSYVDGWAFDLDKVLGSRAADEARPISVGFTPAIYLGVSAS